MSSVNIRNKGPKFNLAFTALHVIVCVMAHLNGDGRMLQRYVKCPDIQRS